MHDLAGRGRSHVHWESMKTHRAQRVAHVQPEQSFSVDQMITGDSSAKIKPGNTLTESFQVGGQVPQTLHQLRVSHIRKDTRPTGSSRLLERRTISCSWSNEICTRQQQTLRASDAGFGLSCQRNSSDFPWTGRLANSECKDHLAPSFAQPPSHPFARHQAGGGRLQGPGSAQGPALASANQAYRGVPLAQFGGQDQRPQAPNNPADTPLNAAALQLRMESSFPSAEEPRNGGSLGLLGGLMSSAGQQGSSVSLACSEQAGLIISQPELSFGELKTNEAYAQSLSARNISSKAIRIELKVQLHGDLQCRVSCRAGPTFVAPGMQWTGSVVVSSPNSGELQCSLLLCTAGAGQRLQVQVPVLATFADEDSSAQHPTLTHISPQQLQHAGSLMLDSKVREAKLQQASGNIGALDVLSPKANAIRASSSASRTRAVGHRNMHYISLNKGLSKLAHPAVRSAQFSHAVFSEGTQSSPRTVPVHFAHSQ